MEWFKKFMAMTGLLAAFTFGTGFVVGCEDDAGDEIEEVGDDIGDGIEEGVENVEEGVENLAD